MASRARRLERRQNYVFSALENNPVLLDLLEIASSTATKPLFTKALLDNFPDAFSNCDQDPETIFRVFTSWFSSYDKSHTSFPGISTALQQRQHRIWDNRSMKRQFITDIGLDWTAKYKSTFFSEVKFLCHVIGEGLISFLDQDDLC